MNFGEILDLAYNLIDETDYDEQVEIIVKNAINEAYADLCRKDKRLTIGYVPIVRGMATLPEDIISIELCTPPLSGADRRVGNAIITDKTGVFEIMYSYTREPLVEDEDVPDLHQDLHRALAIFACYRYFMHRKKIEVAHMFLNNYDTEVFKYELNNTSNDIGVITFIDMSE